MGDWVYTPAATGRANATLHDNCRRVDLRYSAEILEGLLTELGCIEARLAPSARDLKGCDTHMREPWRETTHA